MQDLYRQALYTIKTPILVFFFIISISSIVIAENLVESYNDPVTFSIGDLRWCKRNGVCTLSTLTTDAIVTGNLSVIGEVFNVTMNLVTWNITDSFNVGGDLTAKNITAKNYFYQNGQSINDTIIWENTTGTTKLKSSQDIDMQDGDISIKDSDGEYHNISRDLQISDEMSRNITLSGLNGTLDLETGNLTITTLTGENIAVNIDKSESILDRNSDSIIITSGTNESPILNHIVYTNVGNPVLTKRTTLSLKSPSVAAVLQGATFTYVSATGLATTNNLIGGIFNRFFRDGSTYRSGFEINVSTNNINISTGVISFLFSEIDIIQNHSTSDLYVHVHSDGSFHQHTSLNDCVSYNDGSAVSNNKYFNVVMGIAITHDGAGVMYVTTQDLPSTEYTKAIDAEVDIEDTINFFPPDDIVSLAYIPIVRVVVRLSGGVNTIQTLSNGLLFDDLRGTITKTSSSPPPSGITSYNDLTEIPWTNDGDGSITKTNSGDLDLNNNDLLNAKNINASGNLSIGGNLNVTESISGKRLTIISDDGTDSINISHDNSNPNINWDDGSLIFTGTESENSRTDLDLVPQGTGGASYKIDNIKMFQWKTGNADVTSITGAAANFHLFSSASEGETKELKVSGYRTGDSLRTLEIGVGVDANDTASFDGLSNYLFDGNVEVDGTLDVDDVDISGNTKTTNLNVTDTASLNKLEDTSLVGYWQMSGNAIDSSIYENHGTPTDVVFDKDVAEFDGTNSIIDGVNLTLLSDKTVFTLSQWVKPSELVNGMIMAGFGKNPQSEGQQRFLIRFSNSIYFWGGTHDINTGVDFDNNVWQHIIISANNTNITIYKNGELIKTDSNDLFNTSDNIFSISDISMSGFLEPFNGTIDEVKIYNRALSPAEILQLYNERNKNFGHFNEVITDSISFGEGINISYDGNFLRFDYGETISDTARFSGNISTTGLVTRTSNYDKSRGNALDFIKDSDYYLTNGEIDHSKFYGYAPLTITDFSRPEIIEINCIDIDDNGKEFETVCDRTTYPNTKIEEGVSLNMEVDMLRQSVYDLKTELCVYNDNYNWC